LEFLDNDPFVGVGTDGIHGFSLHVDFKKLTLFPTVEEFIIAQDFNFIF